MKNLLLNSVVACCILPPYLTSPGRAQANDWGCEVILCLSNPGGPTQFAECRPPIQKLWRELAEGIRSRHAAAPSSTVRVRVMSRITAKPDTGWNAIMVRAGRKQPASRQPSGRWAMHSALMLGTGIISATVRFSPRDGSCWMDGANAWAIRPPARTSDRSPTMST